jgi:hypothetical protein
MNASAFTLREPLRGFFSLRSNRPGANFFPPRWGGGGLRCANVRDFEGRMWRRRRRNDPDIEEGLRGSEARWFLGRGGWRSIG